MARKIWVGNIPFYGYCTSYETPDEKLKQYMQEQDVIDVLELTGNPYYEEFMAQGLRQLTIKEEYEQLLSGKYVTNNIQRSDARKTMVKLYAWAVPTPEVIAYIQQFLSQGIYEVGAGSGYWARMIAGSWHNLDYYAYDNYTSHGFTHRYYNVSDIPLTPIELASYHSMLLCWPSYKDTFAYEAVRNLKPRHVFYVGESDGCTADDNFRNIMAELYEEVRGTPDVERHQYINDRFYHYQRKMD